VRTSHISVAYAFEIRSQLVRRARAARSQAAAAGLAVPRDMLVEAAIITLPFVHAMLKAVLMSDQLAEQAPADPVPGSGRTQRSADILVARDKQLRGGEEAWPVVRPGIEKRADVRARKLMFPGNRVGRLETEDAVDMLRKLTQLDIWCAARVSMVVRGWCVCCLRDSLSSTDAEPCGMPRCTADEQVASAHLAATDAAVQCAACRQVTQHVLHPQLNHLQRLLLTLTNHRVHLWWAEAEATAPGALPGRGGSQAPQAAVSHFVKRAQLLHSLLHCHASCRDLLRDTKVSWRVADALAPGVSQLTPHQARCPTTSESCLHRLLWSLHACVHPCS
jgi:hypothetical protein